MVDIGSVGLVQDQVGELLQSVLLPAGVTYTNRCWILVTGKIRPHLHHKITHVSIALSPDASPECHGKYEWSVVVVSFDIQKRVTEDEE